MPEHQIETDPDRFIRLRDGTIYGYTSMLAKRRDATIVDGYAAAQWYKSQGMDNEVTRRFDVTAPLDARPAGRPAPLPASSKPNRNVVKEEQRLARDTKMAERAVKLRRMKDNGKPELQPETAEEVYDPLDKAVGDLLDDTYRR